MPGPHVHPPKTPYVMPFSSIFEAFQSLPFEAPRSPKSFICSLGSMGSSSSWLCSQAWQICCSRSAQRRTVA